VLDLLLARRPWLDEAQPMWDARDDGRLYMYLAASVLTDIFYICRRQVGIDRARQSVNACIQGFSIIGVDRATLTDAIALPGNDFEDNVQIACAQLARLDRIVTRNVAAFALSSRYRRSSDAYRPARTSTLNRL
jgi:hypothetical protein